jgi:DNA-binding ferritin-like protein (Dps family)
MASKIVKEIVIKVTDKGSLKVTTREVDKLNKAVDRSSKANKTHAKSSQTLNRNIKGSSKQSSNASKNFSKQAQGMQGVLVPAYAEVAARVFALTAAFTALSNAANYAILLKGQDAYAKMTGKHMGSIAKAVQVASRHMLDFKEASTSVALASTSGISSKQIIKMTEAAVNSSTALGRSVSDTMDRLTRGIVKAEPEILDEIGVIIRLDKVYKDYAESVSKSTTELTEGEKASARYTAIMGQLESKFGGIADKIDPNHFQALASTVLDLINTISSKLVTGLNPMLKFLADSKGLLMVLMALIAKSLVGKIFPVFEKFGTRIADMPKNMGKATDALNSKIRNLSSTIKKSAAINKSVISQAEKLIPVAARGKAWTDKSQAKQVLRSMGASLTYAEANIEGGKVTGGAYEGKTRSQVELLRASHTKLAKEMAGHHTIMQKGANMVRSAYFGIARGLLRVRTGFYEAAQAAIHYYGVTKSNIAELGFFAGIKVSLKAVSIAWLEAANSASIYGKVMRHVTAVTGYFGVIAAVVGTVVSKLFGWVTALIMIGSIGKMVINMFVDFDRPFNKAAEAASKLVDEMKTISGMYDERESNIDMNREVFGTYENALKNAEFSANFADQLYTASHAAMKKLGRDLSDRSFWDFDWFKDVLGFGFVDNVSKGLGEQLNLMQKEGVGFPNAFKQALEDSSIALNKSIKIWGDRQDMAEEAWSKTEDAGKLTAAIDAGGDYVLPIFLTALEKQVKELNEIRKEFILKFHEQLLAGDIVVERAAGSLLKELRSTFANDEAYITFTTGIGKVLDELNKRRAEAALKEHTNLKNLTSQYSKLATEAKKYRESLLVKTDVDEMATAQRSLKLLWKEDSGLTDAQKLLTAINQGFGKKLDSVKAITAAQQKFDKASKAHVDLGKETIFSETKAGIALHKNILDLVSDAVGKGIDFTDLTGTDFITIQAQLVASTQERENAERSLQMLQKNAPIASLEYQLQLTKAISKAKELSAQISYNELVKKGSGATNREIQSSLYSLNKLKEQTIRVGLTAEKLAKVEAKRSGQRLSVTDLYAAKVKDMTSYYTQMSALQTEEITDLGLKTYLIEINSKALEIYINTLGEEEALAKKIENITARITVAKTKTMGIEYELNLYKKLGGAYSKEQIALEKEKLDVSRKLLELKILDDRFATDEKKDQAKEELRLLRLEILALDNTNVARLKYNNAILGTVVALDALAIATQLDFTGMDISKKILDDQTTYFFDFVHGIDKAANEIIKVNNLILAYNNLSEEHKIKSQDQMRRGLIDTLPGMDPAQEMERIIKIMGTSKAAGQAKQIADRIKSIKLETKKLNLELKVQKNTKVLNRDSKAIIAIRTTFLELENTYSEQILKRELESLKMAELKLALIKAELDLKKEEFRDQFEWMGNAMSSIAEGFGSSISSAISAAIQGKDFNLREALAKVFADTAGNILGDLIKKSLFGREGLFAGIAKSMGVSDSMFDTLFPKTQLQIAQENVAELRELRGKQEIVATKAAEKRVEIVNHLATIATNTTVEKAKTDMSTIDAVKTPEVLSEQKLEKIHSKLESILEELQVQKGKQELVTTEAAKKRVEMVNHLSTIDTNISKQELVTTEAAEKRIEMIKHLSAIATNTTALEGSSVVPQVVDDELIRVRSLKILKEEVAAAEYFNANATSDEKLGRMVGQLGSILEAIMRGNASLHTLATTRTDSIVQGDSEERLLIEKADLTALTNKIGIAGKENSDAINWQLGDIFNKTLNQFNLRNQILERIITAISGIGPTTGGTELLNKSQEVLSSSNSGELAFASLNRVTQLEQGTKRNIDFISGSMGSVIENIVATLNPVYTVDLTLDQLGKGIVGFDSTLEYYQALERDLAKLATSIPTGSIFEQFFGEIYSLIGPINYTKSRPNGYNAWYNPNTDVTGFNSERQGLAGSGMHEGLHRLQDQGGLFDTKLLDSWNDRMMTPLGNMVHNATTEIDAIKARRAALVDPYANQRENDIDTAMYKVLGAFQTTYVDNKQVMEELAIRIIEANSKMGVGTTPDQWLPDWLTWDMTPEFLTDLIANSQPANWNKLDPSTIDSLVSINNVDELSASMADKTTSVLVNKSDALNDAEEGRFSNLMTNDNINADNIVNAIMNMSTGGGGGFGDLFNFSTGNPHTGTNATSGNGSNAIGDRGLNAASGMAMGGIIAGGFRAFSRGGIVDKPTLGLVGEGKYNEAVVPLPDGKSIPVVGARGDNNNITVNVSIDSDGNAKSDSEKEGSRAKAMGYAISQAVQSELLEQRRPGGLLSQYG